MTFFLEYELLTEAEAKELFQPQIDAAALKPYVDWINMFDVGDTVRVTIKKGTSAESARAVKRMLNSAAKQHAKGERSGDGKTRLLAMHDGAPVLEPVKLRWKANTHTEQQTKGDKRVDVVIVDKLSVCLVASVVNESNGTAEQTAPDPTPTTPTPEPAKAGARK